MQLPLDEIFGSGTTHRFLFQFSDGPVQTIDYVEEKAIHLHLKLSAATGMLTVNDRIQGRWNEEVQLPLPELTRNDPFLLELRLVQSRPEVRIGQASLVLANRRGLLSEATMLRWSGGVTFSKETTNHTEPVMKPGANCVGSIDRCTAQLVRGWAADLESRDRPLRLDILVDGKHQGSTVADIWRQDLQDLQPDLACHGFVFRFPAQIPQGDRQEHRVNVLVHGRDLELSCSPWFVSRATPETAPRLIPASPVRAERQKAAPLPGATLIELQASNRLLTEQLRRQEEAQRVLEADLEAKQASLQTRFTELAILTRLLEDNRQRACAGNTNETSVAKPKGGAVVRRMAVPSLPRRAIDAVPSSLPGPAFHVLDLCIDRITATAALNHLCIERAGGLGSRVWNAMQIVDYQLSWQARRMVSLHPGILVEGTPAPGAELFIYGQRFLADLIVEYPLDRFRLHVLVSTTDEVQSAKDALAGADLQGQVQLLDRALLAGCEPDRPGVWPVALHLGLFEQERAARMPAERVGTSLFGRRPTAADEAIIMALRDALPQPLIMLAEPEDRARLTAIGVEVVLIDAAKNFWNDFFGRIGTLVEWIEKIEETPFTGTVGQAFQRRRLVTVLNPKKDAVPGAHCFTTLAGMLPFLRDVSLDAKQHEAYCRNHEEAIRSHYGAGLHLRRLAIQQGPEAVATAGTAIT